MMMMKLYLKMALEWLKGLIRGFRVQTVPGHHIRYRGVGTPDNAEALLREVEQSFWVGMSEHLGTKANRPTRERVWTVVFRPGRELPSNQPARTFPDSLTTEVAIDNPRAVSALAHERWHVEDELRGVAVDDKHLRWKSGRRRKVELYVVETLEKQ